MPDLPLLEARPHSAPQRPSELRSFYPGLGIHRAGRGWPLSGSHGPLGQDPGLLLPPPGRVPVPLKPPPLRPAGGGREKRGGAGTGLSSLPSAGADRRTSLAARVGGAGHGPQVRSGCGAELPAQDCALGPGGRDSSLPARWRTNRLRALEVSLEQVLWSRAPTEREGGPSYFCSRSSPHRLCGPLPGRLGPPTR